jgi:hypothetical protein
MSKSMSEEELYGILRAADPLFGEPERPTAATEASLQRVLARGPGEVGGPRRRSWLGQHLTGWWAVRVVPLAATVAAVAAVISALPSGGPVTVPTASAKVILAKAAAVVAGSDGAILHADVSATQTWRNGHSDYWTEQDWQQVSAPYDDRSIVTGVWPTTIETAYVNGQMWLYDAATNTIYTNEPSIPVPAFTLTAGPRPGTYTLHTGHGSSAVSLTVTASQVAALRDGRDVLASDSQGGHSVVPRPTTGPQILSSFRSEALALLHSATAKVTRNVTVDGQNALEVASADGTSTCYLNPSTYAPIQMTNTIGPGTDMGDPSNDSTVTLKFSDWQYLTGTAANPNLLSLTAQHPDATVDNSAADWNAAASRLFP